MSKEFNCDVTGKWWPVFFVESPKTSKRSGERSIVTPAHCEFYRGMYGDRALLIGGQLILAICRSMLSTADHARNNIAE